MAEERYVRLNESFGDIGKIYSADVLKGKDTYKEVLKTYKFKTLFTWPKEAKEIADKNKGYTKEYQGLGWADYILLDFDCEQDLNKARLDAVKILELLQDKFNIDVTKSCSVDFSGKKGFHLVIQLDKELEREQIKAIALNLIEGIETADRKIYDIQRKIRLRNSKHNDSNLHKIPLTIDEFCNLTMQQIKDLAKQPRFMDVNLIPIDSNILVNYIPVKPKSVVVDDEAEEVNGIRGLNTVNFNLVPPHEPKCVHALLKGVMLTGQGCRNEVFLALVNYLRNQNKNKEQIISELKQTAKFNHELNPDVAVFTEAEIKAKVNAAFSSKLEQYPGATGISPNNETIKKHCELFGTAHTCKLHGKTHPVEEKSPIVNIA